MPMAFFKFAFKICVMIANEKIRPRIERIF
jgi:hypothetical protein